MGISMSEAAPVVAPVSADGVFSVLWLIIALPALGALAILVLGEARTRGWAHLVGTATVAGSFLIGLVAFVALLGRDEADRQVQQHLYTWFEAGSFEAEAGPLFHPLSFLFVLLITRAGGPLPPYSLGFIAHHPPRPGFFRYFHLLSA